MYAHQAEPDFPEEVKNDPVPDGEEGDQEEPDEGDEGGE